MTISPFCHGLLNRALQKLPRGVAIPLELWSDDLTYGRLIEAAERAGDRREVEHLCGEASMDRSLLEDERLERESLKLQANARRHLVAIPHYDGQKDNKYWEQSPRNGRVHLTIAGVAEARKAIYDDFKRRWGRRMFWSNWLPGRGDGSSFLDCTFGEDMA